MNKTQAEICVATKRDVITLPFADISVTTIMKTAHLRRQTFYDYFRDKYDVLGFIYRTEIDEAATYCRHYHYWPQTLRTILRYFAENRDFYRRVLVIDEQNAPVVVIQHHFEEMISAVLEDMSVAERVTLAPSYVHFVQQMMGAAMITAVKEWLLADGPVPLATETEMLGYYLQDSFDGLVAQMRQGQTRAQATG